MKFTELGLSEAMLASIKGVGFEDCTNVQEMALPIALTGKDVMVQSKTGSGKTAVYLITIIEKYLKERGESGDGPVSLVVAPTRELAVQIEQDAMDLCKNIPGYKIGCFYGGVGYGRQNEEIASGLNLYVGTPGRLIDFAVSHKIDFRQFSTVVLDEADRMFDMGFYPDVQKMFKMMRPAAERQTMLLSATLSTKVRNLAWEYMNSPEEIESQPEEITVKSITQELFHVSKDEKFGLLLQLLKKIDPTSCLIFANTKGRTVEVAKRLRKNGYQAEYLMGDMPQGERLKTLDRMKEGHLRILVATDVAARGLQIDDLPLVVNYDIPEDFESYVHRIGRTARAGKSGKAITLACEEYIYGLEAIENFIQMKIPVLWADECDLPEVEDLSKDMVFREAPADRRPNHGERRPRRDDRRGDGRGRFDKKDSFKKEKRDRKGKDFSKPYPKERKKSEEEYSKLAAMSVDERMNYYRKEFSSERKGEGKDARKKPYGGKQGAKKTSKQDFVPRKPEAKAEAKTPAPTPEKKKGLFAKIVSFFTGK